MKTNEDKMLEKLLDTIMKDSKLETPSIDFTSRIMSKVLTTKTSEVYVYRPLISKSVFIIVFGCFVVLLLSLESQTNNWITNLSSTLYSTSLFSFSKTTIYSVVFSTLLLYIQIVFLKKHFDNQFDK